MTPAAITEPLLVNAKQAAKFLGFSRGTFDSLDDKGLLPAPAFSPPGGIRRWSREDLTAWVAAGCPTRERWAARKGAV